MSCGASGRHHIGVALLPVSYVCVPERRKGAAPPLIHEVGKRTPEILPPAVMPHGKAKVDSLALVEREAKHVEAVLVAVVQLDEQTSGSGSHIERVEIDPRPPVGDLVVEKLHAAQHAPLIGGYIHTLPLSARQMPRATAGAG